MSEHTLEYFLNKGTIQRKDAADIEWYHAANSKSKLTQALQGEYKYEEAFALLLQYSFVFLTTISWSSLRNNVMWWCFLFLLFGLHWGSAQMIEADVLLRGQDPKVPIMAHPPDNDSDITLQDWLKEVVKSDKGIKLDFKRWLFKIIYYSSILLHFNIAHVDTSHACLDWFLPHCLCCWWMSGRSALICILIQSHSCIPIHDSTGRGPRSAAGTHVDQCWYSPWP